MVFFLKGSTVLAACHQTELSLHDETFNLSGTVLTLSTTLPDLLLNRVFLLSTF